MARANASTSPAVIPALQHGSLILQKIKLSLNPRVLAESSMLRSKDWKAPRVVRYISGKATTVVAKTVDHQVMVSLISKFSKKKAPINR